MAVSSVLEVVLRQNRATLGGEGEASASADGPLRFQPMASSLPPDMLQHMQEHPGEATQHETEFSAWVKEQEADMLPISDAPLGHSSLHTPLMQRQLRARQQLGWRKQWQKHKQEVLDIAKQLEGKLLLYQQSPSVCIGTSTWSLLQLWKKSESEGDHTIETLDTPDTVMRLRSQFTESSSESRPTVRLVLNDSVALLQSELEFNVKLFKQMLQESYPKRHRARLLDLQLVVPAPEMRDLVGVLADTFLPAQLTQNGSCHLPMLQVWELPGPTVQHDAEAKLPDLLVLSLTNMWQIHEDAQLGALLVHVCAEDTPGGCKEMASQAVATLKAGAQKKEATAFVCPAHSQAAVHRCLTVLALMQAELAPPQADSGLELHPVDAGMVCLVKFHTVTDKEPPILRFYCLLIPDVCRLRPQATSEQVQQVQQLLPLSQKLLPTQPLAVLRLIECNLISDLLLSKEEVEFEKAWPKERALALTAAIQQLLPGARRAARYHIPTSPSFVLDPDRAKINLYSTILKTVLRERQRNVSLVDSWYCPEGLTLGVVLDDTPAKVAPPLFRYLAAHPSLWRPPPQLFEDPGQLSWTGLAARRWLRDSPGQFLAAQQQAAKPDGPDWLLTVFVSGTAGWSIDVLDFLRFAVQDSPYMLASFSQWSKLLPEVQKKSTQWERAVADVLHAWQASNSTVAPSFTSISQQTANLAQGLSELFHLEHKVLNFTILWLALAVKQEDDLHPDQHTAPGQVLLVPDVSCQLNINRNGATSQQDVSKDFANYTPVPHIPAVVRRGAFLRHTEVKSAADRAEIRVIKFESGHTLSTH